MVFFFYLLITISFFVVAVIVMGFANAEYETLKLLQWPNDGIKYQKISNEKKNKQSSRFPIL